MDERHLRWASISGVAGSISALVAVLAIFGFGASRPAAGPAAERIVHYVPVIAPDQQRDRAADAPVPIDSFPAGPAASATSRPDRESRAESPETLGPRTDARPSRVAAGRADIPTARREASVIELKHVAQ